MANTKVTGDLIASLTIATGNIANNAITSDKISGLTTAHITEGANLYYTDARARAAVSVSGNALSYNSSTGVITSNFEESPTFTGIITASSSSSGDYVRLYGSSGTGRWDIYGNGENLRISENSGGGGHVDIDTKLIVDGDVGIGTTSPASKLDVRGTGSFLGAAASGAALVTIENNSGSTATSYGLLVKGGGNSSSGKTFEVRDDSGNTDLIVKGNGNVGIGTTSPETNAKLDVRAGSGGKIVLGSYDANYKVVVEGGDQLNFYNGTSAATAYMNYGFTGTPGNILLSRNLFVEANSSGGTSGTVRIKSDGNVGIGTTSPSSRLHISSSDTGLRIVGTTRSQILLENSTSAWQIESPTSVGNVPAGALGIIEAGVGARLSILTGGNIGIGTISPSAKLEVRGTAPTYTNSSTVFWGGTTNNDSHNGIMLSSYGDALGGSLASNLLYSNSNTPTQTNGNRSSGQIKFENTTVASKTSDINFGGYYKGTTTFVERMRINGDGKVGIGTSSPNKTLTVYGGNDNGIWIDSQGGQYTSLAFGHNGTEKANIAWDNTNGYTNISTYGNGHLALTTGGGIKAFLNYNGNFGIGTTSPLGKLDVYANSGTTTPGVGDGIYVGPSNAAVGMSMVYSNSGYTYSDFISRYNSSSSYMRFIMKGSATPVYAMTIRGNGKVGIGTTAPTRELDVNGEITHQGLVMQPGSNVDRLLTIDKTVSTTANTWTSLDISLSNIGGSGTYAVQVYSNAHGSTGGAWYSMYWSGIMSWYHSSTNDNDIDEIPLHMAGHARNNNTLELRTVLHTNDGTSYANRCELQIKTANTISSAAISFRFRKLL